MDDLVTIIEGTNFTSFDWVIVAVYMTISVVIGIIANRYVTNMGDYIAAGRGVRTALGVATLTGTELGLVTVMYSAQKGFTGGFAAFHIGAVAGVVTLFVGLTGFIVASLRRREVLTIPEFYDKRFGPRIRILGAIVLSLGGIMNMGMFLKAGSIFIVGITGLPTDGNALTIVMLALLSLVLFYTILGGMVSVVLADYVQFVALSFGLLFATGLAIVKLGWGNIFESMIELKGEAGFNPMIAESTFGVDYIVWMGFIGLISCAVWPTAVARALAAESPTVVKRQFTWAAVSYTVRFIIPYFWGICAFVLIMKTPEMKEAFFPSDPQVEAADSLYAMPIFMGRLLPAGLIGIITAAMVAAFMSTHDSYLLCWSSVITHDIISPITGGTLSQHARITVTRVLIFLIGAIVFMVSFMFPLKEDMWDYMAVTGTIYAAGAFALLAGGLYWERASSTGAGLALVAGCLAIFGLKAIQEVIFIRLLRMPPEWLEHFTGARVGLVAVALTIVAMIAGSLLFPDKKTKEEGKIA